MAGENADDQRIDDSDQLLRRFNPGDSNSVCVDEGTGARRIRSGAFRFDEELPGDLLGCSVFQSSVLAELGLGAADCTEGRYTGVAAGSVGQVRGISRGGEQQFDARRDPLLESRAEWQLRDRAHALITIPGPATGKPRWFSLLAGKFTIVVDGGGVGGAAGSSV